jgi:hypothetical protein
MTQENRGRGIPKAHATNQARAPPLELELEATTNAVDACSIEAKITTPNATRTTTLPLHRTTVL